MTYEEANEILAKHGFILGERFIINDDPYEREVEIDKTDYTNVYYTFYKKGENEALEKYDVDKQTIAEDVLDGNLSLVNSVRLATSIDDIQPGVKFYDINQPQSTFEVTKIVSDSFEYECNNRAIGNKDTGEYELSDIKYPIDAKHLMIIERGNQPTKNDRYPHTCEYCSQPCWNGAFYDCSNNSCPTKR